MDTFFAVPATGRLVRDPETGAHLVAAGREVPTTPYWRRRRKDGDIFAGKNRAEAEAARAAAETPAPPAVAKSPKSKKQES